MGQFKIDYSAGSLLYPRGLDKLKIKLQIIYKYLYSKATFRPRIHKKHMVQLESGQAIITMKEMESHFSDLKLTAKQLRIAVNNLEKLGLITSESLAGSTKLGTLYTIIDYSRLTSFASYGEHAEATEVDTKTEKGKEKGKERAKKSNQKGQRNEDAEMPVNGSKQNWLAEIENEQIPKKGKENKQERAEKGQRKGQRGSAKSLNSQGVTLPELKSIELNNMSSVGAKLTPEQIVDLWNELAANDSTEIAPVTMITKNRRQRLSSLAWLIKSYSDWQLLFSEIESNPYYQGRNKTQWIIKFDWLLYNDRIIGVLEEIKKRAKRAKPATNNHHVNKVKEAVKV